MLEIIEKHPLIVVFGVGVLVGVPVLMGVFRWFLRWYVKVDQGQALIINGMKGLPNVTFTGGLVVPIINRAEIMDISLKTIEIDRNGSEGLICQDNIRADIKVTFFVRVNSDPQDVLNVAQSIGCQRASQEETIQTLFGAKFSEALKTAGRKMNFVELYQERTRFKEAIKQTIGEDLNGYKLEDVAIDYLEQTPVTKLNADNILDAQGIKKITELTAAEKIKANEIRRHQEKTITQQDVDAKEKILEMQRQQAEAELRQRKEIDVIRAREEAEAKKTVSEELARAEAARIKAEEEIAILEQNRDRQVMVAEKNKERVVAVEAERVTKDKNLEIIKREREVELQRIDKEKALEIERKQISEVIRERVAVEKTVAEEEERIKDTRALMAAERSKKVAVLEAEQHAQEQLVKDIKAAEAQEIASRHKATEMLTIAEAEFTRSEKVAKAKSKLAEGITAEAAAQGLAQVKVKEADAAAIERVGVAEAKALRERVEAEAHGISKKGNAEAEALKLRAAAEAAGIEARGLAEGKSAEARASGNEKQLLAEAAGTREKMLAEAAGREAAASAIEKQGLAEAAAIREKLLAEAAGLAEKATSMKALDESSRAHEEFRIKLQKEKEIELAEIQARQVVASRQAEAMAEAFKQMKVDIVGGDGAFFEKFVGAVSAGRSVDAFVNNSRVTQAVAKDYLSGDASLIQDVKDVLTGIKVSSEDFKNLSIAALLGKLLAGTSDDTLRVKLQKLLSRAQELGVADKPLGEGLALAKK